MRDAKGASIMCSYNALNGVPSCANGPIQNTVVRDEWGFEGFIVSPRYTITSTVAHKHMNIDIRVRCVCHHVVRMFSSVRYVS